MSRRKKIEENPRNKSMHIRVSPQDYLNWRKVAKLFGLNLTDYVINCLNSHANKRIGQVRDFDRDLKRDF